MTQFGFPNLLGVFLQNAPAPLPTMNNQAALVDLALEGLPFGAIVNFKVRNGTNAPGRWLVRVELKSLQYGFIRRGSSIALNLAAGDTSSPQRIVFDGIPRDGYEATIRLEKSTGQLESTVVQTVEVGGPSQTTRFRQQESAFFLGSVVFADGPAVPPGTVLTARVGGRQGGSVVIRSPGTFGIGTDPLLVRNNLASAGDPVSFFVDGLRAVETAPYRPDGQPQRVTLTVPR